MSLRLPILVSLILVAAVASAQKNSEKVHTDVPPELVKARWVFLTSYSADGGDYLTRPDPADLATIVDVRKALRDWGYYKDVSSPDAADLIIAVRRKTNALNAGSGLGIDLSTSGGVRVNPTRRIGGPAEDAMSVFSSRQGSNGVVIWKRMKKDGLHTPKMQLVSDLRDFVESAKP